MNLESKIVEYIDMIDSGWFRAESKYFKDHPLYDKSSDTIKYLKNAQEQFDEMFDEVIEMGYGISSPSDPKAMLPLTKTLRDFCWSHKTEPQYEEKIWDLDRILELIVHRLDTTLSLTGSMSEKHQIITKAKDIIKTETKINENEDQSKNLLYKSLMEQFIQKIMWRINYNYRDVLWFTEAFSLTPAAKQIILSPSEEKKKLSQQQFEDIFNLFDELFDPIIKDEDLSKKSVYVNYLYNLYKTGSPDKKIKTIVIDFNWDKHPIYYIITQIIKTKTKLTLKHLEQLKCIRIKGEPFNSRHCSAGASKFAINPKSKQFKDVIDDTFLS